MQVLTVLQILCTYRNALWLSKNLLQFLTEAPALHVVVTNYFPKSLTLYLHLFDILIQIQNQLGLLSILIHTAAKLDHCWMLIA